MEQAEATKYLQEQLAIAETNMQGLSDRSKMAQTEAEKLEPTWLSLGQAGRKVWLAQVAEYEELRQRYGEASDYVQKLRAEIERSEAAFTSQPNEALDKVTAKLQEQIAVTGMTADEAERWKLSQAGVNETLIASVAIMQQQAAAAQAAVDLDVDRNSIVDDLQRQIQTAGRSNIQTNRR